MAITRTIPVVAQRVPRREREKLTRRKEILDAARQVFAVKGYGDTTLDDVAELAEFGKGTLYNYFTNKEALFATVLGDSFNQILEYTTQIFRTDGTLEQKIEQFVRRTLEYFFSDPESFHLMTREATHLRGSNPLLHLLPQLLDIIAQAVATEQRKRKLISAVQPHNMALLLVHMIFGQYMMYCFQCDCIKKPENKDDWAAQILQEIKTMNRTEIVDSAARAVTTVFFNGIKR